MKVLFLHEIFFVTSGHKELYVLEQKYSSDECPLRRFGELWLHIIEFSCLLVGAD